MKKDDFYLLITAIFFSILAWALFKYLGEAFFLGMIVLTVLILLADNSRLRKILKKSGGGNNN